MAVDVIYTIRAVNKATGPVQEVTKGFKQADSQAVSLNNTVKGLGATLRRAFAAIGAIRAAKEVLTLGINMEQTRVAFATFLGDAEKANTLIDQLNEFSNVTPFDNAQVIQSGRILLSAGTAAEDVTSQLKMVGDVAAGANVPLNELANIYAKAMNKGKLQAEELNQLSERGIPIIQVLSEKFGVTKEEVFKLGSEGKITSQVMNQAFNSMTSEGGLFFDMMRKQSETAGGRLSTLLGKAQTLGIKIGEALLPAVNAFADFSIALLDNSEALKTIGIVLGIASVAWIGWKVGAIAAAIANGSFAASLATVNAMLLANPVGLVVAAIAALVAIVVVVTRHYEEWGAAMTIVLGPLGMVINLVKSFQRNWDSITKAFKEEGIVSGIKKIGVAILDSVLMPMQQLVEIVAEFTGAEWAKKAADNILEFRNHIGAKDARRGRAGLNAFNPSQDAVNFAIAAQKAKTGATTTNAATGGGGSVPPVVTPGGTPGISEVKAAAPKVFNINIDKLVERFEIVTNNMRETPQQIKDEVARALTAAVADAQIIAG